MQGTVDCPLPVVFFHYLAHMGRVVQRLHLLHPRGEELCRILREVADQESKRLLHRGRIVAAGGHDSAVQQQDPPGPAGIDLFEVFTDDRETAPVMRPITLLSCPSSPGSVVRLAIIARASTSASIESSRPP